jgi:hypothetical protein
MMIPGEPVREGLAVAVRGRRAYAPARAPHGVLNPIHGLYSKTSQPNGIRPASRGSAVLVPQRLVALSPASRRSRRAHLASFIFAAVSKQTQESLIPHRLFMFAPSLFLRLRQGSLLSLSDLNAKGPRADCGRAGRPPPGGPCHA